ncbi:hypothetical protein M231_06898 [Tremella mesenterica]|uniref:Uncharacterized protein n=1 Tax=Tremella mesenterica TaxID=5217 RepID=A0A4V1M371_TREME|nr:hypothetical protein M231_06898 [Tremella mesenterica]
MTTVPPPVKTSGSTDGSIIDQMVKFTSSFIENSIGVPMPSAPKWGHDEIKVWVYNGTMGMAFKADRSLPGRAQRLESIYQSACKDFALKNPSVLTLNVGDMKDTELGGLWYESVCHATESENDKRRDRDEAAHVSYPFSPYVVHRLPAAPTGCVWHTHYRTVPPPLSRLQAFGLSCIHTESQATEGSGSGTETERTSDHLNDESLEALIIMNPTKDRESTIHGHEVVQVWHYSSRTLCNDQLSNGSKPQPTIRRIPRKVGEALGSKPRWGRVIREDGQTWVLGASTGKRYGVIFNYGEPVPDFSEDDKWSPANAKDNGTH